MKTINKIMGAICFAFALGAVGTQLTACGSILPIVSEVRDAQGYTDPQTMLVVATERNRYRKIYTDQIWSVAVDEEGNSFQTYLLEQIKEFLTKTKTLELLAKEKEISLTSQEKEQLKQLSAKYFASLTQGDIDYMGVSQEDVNVMYEAYHLSNRVVEELTKDVNLEISDSEAKVMVVQEMKTGDETAARQFYSQAIGEGANFLSLARPIAGEEPVEVSVGRSERGKEYDDQVFNLEAEQITEPFFSNGQWYVVKCVNPYDEAATLERKQKLALQRKNQAFSQVYDTFAEEHPLELGGGIWENVDFHGGESCVTTDFFELYEEFMKQ